MKIKKNTLNTSENFNSKAPEIFLRLLKTQKPRKIYKTNNQVVYSVID
jgi:hypothetical protein